MNPNSQLRDEVALDICEEAILREIDALDQRKNQLDERDRKRDMSLIDYLEEPNLLDESSTTLVKTNPKAQRRKGSKQQGRASTPPLQYKFGRTNKNLKVRSKSRNVKNGKSGLKGNSVNPNLSKKKVRALIYADKAVNKKGKSRNQRSDIFTSMTDLERSGMGIEPLEEGAKSSRINKFDRRSKQLIPINDKTAKKKPAGVARGDDGDGFAKIQSRQTKAAQPGGQKLTRRNRSRGNLYDSRGASKNQKKNGQGGQKNRTGGAGARPKTTQGKLTFKKGGRGANQTSTPALPPAPAPEQELATESVSVTGGGRTPRPNQKLKELRKKVIKGHIERGYLKPTKTSQLRSKSQMIYYKRPDTNNKNSKNNQSKHQRKSRSPIPSTKGNRSKQAPRNQKRRYNSRGHPTGNQGYNSKNNAKNGKANNRNQKSGDSQKQGATAAQNQRRAKHDLKFFDEEDLFSKLNALTKMNSNMDKVKNSGLDDDSGLGYSSGEPEDGNVSRNQKRRQKTKNPTNFLENKLNEMKQKRRNQQQRKIDYDRLLNPKHAKKATDLKNECTFQPMLSKKSLDLASKLGDTKSRLYSKRSINYTNKAGEESEKSKKFTPKINEKSKYLDEKKGGQKLSRFERLNQMGEKYNARLNMKIKDKENEEMANLQAMSFHPRVGAANTRNKFDVSLAERSSRWAEKRKEKMRRKREEFRKREEEYCSFKPKINKSRNSKAPESLYSSKFMQDGIKNYFTRLEMARKMKREAHDRLNNWGRAKSVRRGAPSVGGYSQNGGHSGFQTPNKAVSCIGGNQQSSAKSAISNVHSSYMGVYQGGGGPLQPRSFHNNTSHECRTLRERNLVRIRPTKKSYTDQEINDTIAVLRKNLQGIQIHLTSPKKNPAGPQF